MAGVEEGSGERVARTEGRFLFSLSLAAVRCAASLAAAADLLLVLLLLVPPLVVVVEVPRPRPLHPPIPHPSPLLWLVPAQVGSRRRRGARLDWAALAAS